MPVTGAATYKATYSATVNEYTVSFETSGGTLVSPVSVRYGESVGNPETPEKKSFAFAGWYADESLETPYDFSSKVVSDVKIYAKWTPITYTVIGGVNPVWEQGGKEDVAITVKRGDGDDTCFDHFTGVEIDGKALENVTDYTANGGTVVTLKAETLSKLSDGEHTVTVNFDDGKAETSLTVKRPSSNVDPAEQKTDKNGHVVIWIAAATVVGSGIVATTVVRINKKRVKAKKR